MNEHIILFSIVDRKLVDLQLIDLQRVDPLQADLLLLPLVGRATVMLINDGLSIRNCCIFVMYGDNFLHCKPNIE